MAACGPAKLILRRGLVLGRLLGAKRNRLALVNALDEFIQDLGTGTGNGLSGMDVGFHPCEQKQERNPSAGFMFEFRAYRVKDAREPKRQFNRIDLKDGWIIAVRGRRSDQVLAANERPDGVNGAGLVLKEWTRNAGVEVVER